MFNISQSSFCAGLDPSVELLRQWGLADDIRGLEAFGEICLEALRLAPAVVKPQAAYYEQFGARGIAALQRTIRELTKNSCPVILDVKRGDIDSTARAYARAWLGDDSASPVQGITVSPWLGLDSLRPFFDLARDSNAVVFVVVRSSNPDGSTLQEARTDHGLNAAQWLCESLADLNQSGAPCAGAVIGATQTSVFTDLATRLADAPILAPGVGAQGATLNDLAKTGVAIYKRTIVPISRAWLKHGPDVKKLAASTREWQAQDAKLRN